MEIAKIDAGACLSRTHGDLSTSRTMITGGLEPYVDMHLLLWSTRIRGLVKPLVNLFTVDHRRYAVANLTVFEPETISIRV